MPRRPHHSPTWRRNCVVVARWLCSTYGPEAADTSGRGPPTDRYVRAAARHLDLNQATLGAWARGTRTASVETMADLTGVSADTLRAADEVDLVVALDAARLPAQKENP